MFITNDTIKSVLSLELNTKVIKELLIKTSLKFRIEMILLSKAILDLLASLINIKNELVRTSKTTYHRE